MPVRAGSEAIRSNPRLLHAMVPFWPIAVQPSPQSSPSAFFATHTPQTPAKLIMRRKALDLFNDFDMTVGSLEEQVKQ